MRELKTVSVLLIIMLFCGAAQADIIPVDLNNFWADFTVTIAPDGSSATMVEDIDFKYVLLSNDPTFGDPGIEVPEDLIFISFNFEFNEGVDNSDSFYAKLFNGDSGDLIDEFYTESTGAGSVSWNLSSLDPSVTLLGVEFQLYADDVLQDSSLTISDVLLTTQTAAVPELSTLLLFSAGLITYAGTIRSRNHL